MKEFYELAQKRRSHRKFTPEDIAAECMQNILEAALMSPTSKGLHSYSFCVVENPELLTRLSAAKTIGGQFVAEAKCAIVVAADPAISDVWIEDASTAAMSMLYQAEDLGLGACWVQVRARENSNGQDSEDIVREILSLPNHLRIVCMVVLGHKGMERKPQNMDKIRSLMQEKVSYL